MKHLVLILCSFVLCFSSSAQQKSDTSTIIRQVSYAEESPNVSNVSGNVTIIYGCVAKEVTTTNMYGSLGSATGINSSGIWNITNSSSDNNTSLLAMSSILPPDNLNSAWHLSGTITSAQAGSRFQHSTVSQARSGLRSCLPPKPTAPCARANIANTSTKRIMGGKNSPVSSMSTEPVQVICLQEVECVQSLGMIDVIDIRACFINTCAE